MARPLAYDPMLVTDRALAVFWQRGYDGCSIADLTTACGINRQSLYNQFTDKRGAFLAALARYTERLDAALAPLQAPDATRDDLADFLRQTLALQHQMNSGACLLVITAFGPQLQDADIRHAVEAGANRTRNAFAALLARQSVPDPDAAAAFLYGIMTGLSALARTGGAPEQIEATLDIAFAALTPKERP
jgi:TetR/AcrR family transcriptional repressor of nem operon